MKTKSKTASAKAKATPARKLTKSGAAPAKRAAAVPAKRAAATTAKRAAAAPAKRAAATTAKRAAAAPAKRAAAVPAKRAAATTAKRAAAVPDQRASSERALRSSRRSDDADAFIRDPGEGPARTSDALAEVLAEDFLESATSGNDVLEDDLDRTLPEEVGGPFVITRANEELADGVDASNPADAKREPIPTAVSGLFQRPLDDESEEETENERA
jgi:hypothetical protein